ncbi:hypothetical protein [Halomarina litorea]|uniref:hypothetical protein n=1 Tax=Halomarina litorea TaxID=2961595 RepID=UPI0020C4BF06|nr:hypothetical protein [Halomarina sp. BCD28]
MDLDRRTLLRTLPTFLGVATAGCSLPFGSRAPEPTVSEPRHITVYNDDDEAHEVTVTVLRGREGDDQVFETTFDLAPAASDRTEGVSHVGEYRIRVETAAGEEATALWQVKESRGEAQVSISREGTIAIGQEVRTGSEQPPTE